MKFVGRKKPYTVAEMRLKSCCACGGQAVHQWQCCANGNRWLPLCLPCDVALNEVALAFLRIPRRAALLSAYRRQSARQG
jgi:hypothetical protein